VCGTIERSSCSRSQGHSLRRRRVIASRRSSASTTAGPLTARPFYLVVLVVGVVLGVDVVGGGVVDGVGVDGVVVVFGGL
jgi:hypothetical protein